MTFGDAVIAESAKWLGTPYAWGGGTVNGPSKGISDGGGAGDKHGDFLKTGFDCSGLVLRCVYVASGGKTSLPHRADIQRTMGESVPFGTQQPGDIIAFSSNRGMFFHHIGIYMGNDMVRSAPFSGAFVRDDPITAWAKETKVVRRFGDVGTGTPATVTPNTTDNPPITGKFDTKSMVIIGGIVVIGAVIVFSASGIGN